MAFSLNSENVFDYLQQQGLCTAEDRHTSEVTLQAAKNFNLLVALPNGRKLLVKQERFDHEGQSAGEFHQEWLIQDLVTQFPALQTLSGLLPRVLHFDPENSIIVFAYLNDYCDLGQYYRGQADFDTRIAAALGTATAMLHKATYERRAYRDFIEDNRTRRDPMTAFAHSMERVEPEHFGRVPDQGLRFFVLYQRYESLSAAVRELVASVEPSCLTHNDLKLNNILLHKQWQTETEIVRVIDWERCNWQDPAYDLGTVLAGYVHIWLNSLVISDALSLNESLRMAATPLERLQPSMAALIAAYRQEFTEIFAQRPDFLVRVVQFIGLVLIQNIQAMVEYQKSFGNLGICMLQVAKSLLCQPEQAMTTVFGAPMAIAA